jgi:hypothetical protein
LKKLCPNAARNYARSAAGVKLSPEEFHRLDQLAGSTVI